MKASQLDRLRQLGDLREKGLLTDEEFAQQKAAVMGSREAQRSEARRGTRWMDRIAILLAVALAGVALYFALDARNKASSDAKSLRAGIVASRPKLVIDSVSTAFERLPADGFRHNIEAICHYPSVVLGGGFAVSPSSGPPELLASTPLIGEYLVGAASPSGTRHVDANATCAHGENGLTVEGPTP